SPSAMLWAKNGSDTLSISRKPPERCCCGGVCQPLCPGYLRVVWSWPFLRHDLRNQLRRRGFDGWAGSSAAVVWSLVLPLATSSQADLAAPARQRANPLSPLSPHRPSADGRRQSSLLRFDPLLRIDRPPESSLTLSGFHCSV